MVAAASPAGQPPPVDAAASSASAPVLADGAAAVPMPQSLPMPSPVLGFARVRKLEIASPGCSVLAASSFYIYAAQGGDCWSTC